MNILDAAAAEKENRSKQPTTITTTNIGGGSENTGPVREKPKILLKAGQGLPSLSQPNHSDNHAVNNAVGKTHQYPPTPPVHHIKQVQVMEEKAHSPSSSSQHFNTMNRSTTTNRAIGKDEEEEASDSDSDDDSNWKQRRQKMKANRPQRGAMPNTGSGGMYPSVSKAKSHNGYAPATTITRGGGEALVVDTLVDNDETYYQQLQEVKLQKEQFPAQISTPTTGKSTHGGSISVGSVTPGGRMEETPVKAHKEQPQQEITPMRISSNNTTPCTGGDRDTQANTSCDTSPPPSLLTINKRSNKSGKLLKIAKK